MTDGLLRLTGFGRLYDMSPTYFPDGKKMPGDLREHNEAWARVADPARPEQWVVGQDWIGQLWLSTVWIGELAGTFETALFCGTHKDYDLVDVLARWDDWYNALRGHHLFLTELQLRFALGERA